MRHYLDDESEPLHICHECISDEFLSQQTRVLGSIALCNYCGDELECFSIEDLSFRIEAAFADHYIRTSDQPSSWQQTLLSDRESDYNWYREGMPVIDAIEDAAGIPHNAASDVQEILQDRNYDIDSAIMGEETEFDAESHYEPRTLDSGDWHFEWRDFEKSLREEARFFSHRAAELLGEIFGNIDQLQTSNGRPLVVEAKPNGALKNLYRARVFQTDTKLEQALLRPDVSLGPPPANLAGAGRMNAKGISVFYGATSEKTALAEVRPPVGSKILVAKFHLLRPLQLLDLTKLEAVHDSGSIFDPTLKRRLERVSFLQSLGRMMTRPVMPDDEYLDYLPTQAIADFLATENSPSLDGIIFKSAQVKNGRNVVLFHHASLVKKLDLPKKTNLSANTGIDTDEGWDPNYTVYEAIFSETDSDNLSVIDRLVPLKQSIERESSLCIDIDSFKVHEINWASYRSTSFEVSRHRFDYVAPPKFSPPRI